MKPYVVAVAGIPGSEASVICDSLCRRIPHSAVLHFYDFLSDPHLYDQCLADKNSFDSLEPSGFVDELCRLLTVKKLDCIIVDFPFGRCVESLSFHIDYVFYVRAYPDVALARLALQALKTSGAEKLRLQLRLYNDVGVKIVRKIERLVPPKSDMTLSQELPGGEAEELIYEKLKALLTNRWIVL